MAKVFLALDYPDAKSAWPMAKAILPVNPCLKVGLELFVAEGPSFVSELRRAGAGIFLDLKFHDIPNTVAGSVRSALRLGVSYLNVHCAGGPAMLKAAAEACADEASRLSVPRPKLLGVTVLTSLSDSDLREVGYDRNVAAQVQRFVGLANASGLDGVVCSALELEDVARQAGPDFVTMVPGIRPTGSAVGDQKRTLSPAEAVRAGAHCLVVGRPVTGAADPVQAMKDILREVQS